MTPSPLRCRHHIWMLRVPVFSFALVRTKADISCHCTLPKLCTYESIKVKGPPDNKVTPMICPASFQMKNTDALERDIGVLRNTCDNMVDEVTKITKGAGEDWKISIWHYSWSHGPLCSYIHTTTHKLCGDVFGPM